MPADKHSSHGRDAAMRRLRNANRWIVAVSAALTGVLTAVAANASIGKAHKATGHAGALQRHPTKGPRANPRHTRTSSPKPLAPPTQAPQSAPAQTGRSEAEPSQEPSPTPEPSQEPSPTPEPAPEAPAEKAPPVREESTPEPAAPTPESPVVSGGS